MIPTLNVGDFILVNKYAYGIRLPVIGTKIISVDDPERGEVDGIYSRMRINTTLNELSDYRATVRYENKTLFINGEEIQKEYIEISLSAPVSGSSRHAIQ